MLCAALKKGLPVSQREGHLAHYVQVVTELGRRLQDAPGNYGCWVHLLADTLDLPLTDFPITPPHTAPTLMLSPMLTADQSARALALQPLPLSVSRALRWAGTGCFWRHYCRVSSACLQANASC